MTDLSRPEYLEQEEIVNRIGAGVTVITGNMRLARALHKRFDHYFMGTANKVWETPDILPWDAWLRRCLNSINNSKLHAEPPLLLSETQERLLWEQTIEDKVGDHGLLQIPATARQCGSAWALMQAWQLDESDFKYFHNEDSRAFLRWRTAFVNRCQAASWLSPAQLPELLCAQSNSAGLPLPEKIIMTGFDELSPQQQQLLEAIGQQGCEVEWLEKSACKANVSTLSFTHAREEIESAARWARHIMQSNPASKVAIVAPELNELKTTLQTIFDRIFVPSSLHPGVTEAQRPYNISLGEPLIQYPLVQTAMQLLRLQQNSISIEEVSLIVQSPFLGGWEHERFARAQLDRQLREYGTTDISLGLLMGCAGRVGEVYHCPLLHAMLLSYRSLLAKLPSRCHTTDWSQHFSALLAAFEFSKGRTLSSDEYQTIEAWNTVLYDLVKLDKLGGSLNFQQAFRILLQTASERIFQPRSDDVAVQVLGVMEATGLEFDYVWIMGMHDGIWPPAPRPNPFIPAALQRQKMMPHSSPQRQLQVARHITARLAGNAIEVIFSYPTRKHDDVLRPSPLLQAFSQSDHEQLPQWRQDMWQTLIFNSARTENWSDSSVPLADVNNVRGGSQVFKLQAMCPFRAFAELRLGARPMAEPGMGLDAAERGSLLHQVMEYFWRRVMNQKNLLNLSEQQSQELIAECVSRAVDKLESSTQQTFNERFKRLEKTRLEKLIYDWLQIEKQRQAFSVYATEQTVSAYIKGMQIKLKIDRIDELENGERLLIDYKTGTVTPAQWFGERPEEPQLPLYSLVQPEQLSGLLFAQIKSGETGFRGVTREQDVIAGVKSCQQLRQAKEVGDWDELLVSWKSTIESLAEGYKQGHAAVDPLNYPGSCQFCRLHQVCRISELTAADGLQVEGD